MTHYLVYDVFTDTPYCGNPLAVIPIASELPEDRLRMIAREFNYSETVFVYPPAEPANTARLRIFTPTQELPFAGHPVIGAAVALRALGRPAEMRLELGVGPIAVRARRGKAAFTVGQRLDLGATVDAQEVAACLGLDATDIATATHSPTIASVGLPFVLAELAGPKALERATPAVEAFRAAARAYPSDFDFAVYAYLRDGEAVRARMFAPLDGTPEDPATGSAAAALGAFLAEQTGADLALSVAQGVEMGRPSRIGVEVALADGRAAEVIVAGAAVRVMSGTLD